MYIIIKDGLVFKRFNLEDISIPYLYKGIEINFNRGHYNISLKNGYFFEDRDKVRRLEYKHYVIKNKDIFNDIEIFVYENDKGFNEYKLYENKTFIFLASKDANIINKDRYIKNTYLVYQNGSLKTNADCLLVNNKKYNNELLKNGDEIRLYNLHIIYNDEYLYINNFLSNIRLKNKVIKENIVKYQNKVEPLNNYYLEPIKELEIEPISEYNEIKSFNQKKLIYQIGPSLTMTFATLAIASINVYNNYLNDAPLLNSIIYIIMPITMIISSILWPIISRASENRSFKKERDNNKEEYLDGLLAYKNKLSEDINDYINKRKEYYFDGYISKDKLFYITNKSEEFLSISLGLITLSKDVEAKNVKDLDVNEKIQQIKYQLKNIENCPYFIKILNYKAISFVSSKTLKSYLIRRFMLEVSSKYHYDDFNMALYSDDIEQYSDFFSLPQFILNNNRLTFNSTRDLQELNNKCLVKPLVLFCDKRINIEFSNPNIHILSFINESNNVYKNTDLLIEYKDDYGYVYNNEKIKFKYDKNDIDYKVYADLLGNYQKINYLNKTYSFKDIFDNYNIKELYSNTQKSLQADFAFTNNEQLSFDLHESKNGPHGLIGGATGSGKSELIVSLLLSLCIRYRPDYLNIILIDYKGGGIRESLSYKGRALPHIIASIDNLDKDVFERLMVSIDRECKKRQRLFKELSSKTNNSIMNIDDYINNNPSSFGLDNLAHLLIVVDEFAELKKENPTIIKELISFSRIGRSLGLHLILATQRPNGSIDDEIWSNSRFKIALKVFNEKDSNDIIKSSDAAYLNNPGEFILNIDGNTTKAKSIYSKGDVNNGEPYEVCLLNNKLDIVSKKTIKNNNVLVESNYIIEKILNTIDELNIKTNILEFNKPISKSQKDLNNLYKNNNGIILGEVDDYLNAKKDLLTINSLDNSLIYSSRDNEINTILNGINNKCVVIGNKRSSNSYICDSILYDEIEDINYLFNKLVNNKDKLTIVIEDLSCLLTYNDDFSNKIYSLLRRSEVNNVNIIALTKQSAINFRLINSFNNKYVIKMSDRQDLINLFSCGSNYIGDSYFYNNGQLISFVPCVIDKLNVSSSLYESILDKIPDAVNIIKNIDSISIGYDINNRQEVSIKNNEDILISSNNEEILEKYKDQLSDCPNVSIKLYDHSLLKERFNKLLWIGDGIFSQRLFYYDGKNDLDNNHGYLFKGNKGNILKVASYE